MSTHYSPPKNGHSPLPRPNFFTICKSERKSKRERKYGFNAEIGTGRLAFRNCPGRAGRGWRRKRTATEDHLERKSKLRFLGNPVLCFNGKCIPLLQHFGFLEGGGERHNLGLNPWTCSEAPHQPPTSGGATPATTPASTTFSDALVASEAISGTEVLRRANKTESQALCAFICSSKIYPVRIVTIRPK